VPKLIPPVVEPGILGRTEQPRVVVDTELTLRPWRDSDAQRVMDAFSVPDIQHWHFRRYDTLHEAGEWITACQADWEAERVASWAITRSLNDEVIGRVALYFGLEDGYAQISYWVLPKARGQGVATRSVIAATGWAHALGLFPIELQHSIQNESSGRVADKAGYISEGVRRGANLHDDGWHDMRLHSHLATD
jgi:RimJ/RimL family protein N-acetyltransferase